jgi:hypothetical protein
LRFIGVAEVLGAVGLILPWLLGIRPGLTPLTAAGLVIIMTGAMVLTLAEVVPGVVAGALIPLVVGLLSARRLRSLAADASIADPQVPVMFEIAVRGRGTCIWYGRVKI